MGFVASSTGQLEIHSPEGHLKLVPCTSGQVLLTGNQPQWRTSWYFDLLKGAEEAIRHPQRCSKEIVVKFVGEPMTNTAWALKLIEAGRDGIRRFNCPERETAIPVGPNGHLLDRNCSMTGRFGRYRILPGRRR